MGDMISIETRILVKRIVRRCEMAGATWDVKMPENYSIAAKEEHEQHARELGLLNQLWETWLSAGGWDFIDQDIHETMGMLEYRDMWE